ncbi:SRPBCC domain-containing protein [Maribacter hydrothermalis]|uniref:Activator of HSP90 ATPase n=1 Tax=Maribacter hydrothermalis TaxID=1836467 RepID=A0A1B7Z848_9FLAO|nr:SRPBCC domain-containing protein [Maribacter hydrothermalis]APQ19114.1 activator of HSP90 ATPase [Maribacter hydrothermalis]OBR38874.1 activator of HSP90 ATPase [Maribacter hydrothermalis]
MEKIKIHTVIKSDIKKVWELYTDPKHIVNWNFASEDWCCPNAENNLEVGGVYNVRMEAKDKSFGFDMKGIYTEVVPFNYFEYEFAKRSVRVDFTEIEDSTKVEIVFVPETENSIDMQKAGWQSILNNFKIYVENN